MTKKELIVKTDRKLLSITEESKKLQENLKLITQKTFRKKYLTILGLLSLIVVLNKIKCLLYSANNYCEEFLLQTGRTTVKSYTKKKRNG